jgi:DNA-binding MarR family transcriptional regulator
MSAYNGCQRFPKLSSTQLYALALIAKSQRDDPPNLSRLSKQLGLPIATITKAASDLAADGYIDRTRDGASIYLSLTTKGAEQLAALSAILSP